MANEKHLGIIKQGVEAWNKWRHGNNANPNLSAADLSGTNLCGANLDRANLEGANLSGAKLRSANLRDANLRDANLSSADLGNAHLMDARLGGADLSGADLSGADLWDADLYDSDLRNANLRGAELSGTKFDATMLEGADFQGAHAMLTIFTGCDLSKVKHLTLVYHTAPSAIGIDTIYESKGNIPESFLRDCGVPESFITQMYSLVGAEDGIQFYSCFISYSGKDEDFAKRLHGKMRDAHLRVWFAPEDIQGGKKLHEQIETAIRFYDKLLVVLSQASLQSEWVMDELRKGFKAERDTGKRKLFPVRLIDYETLERWECRDSLSGKDLAEEVRQYFIPDFSNWKDHDQFEAAFARLLKDLRADERAK
ncbi:MAG TPA: toll/interleukin-1 receptor domain-containing protein [Chthoniobacterales bacterium]|nr:toll/interleukin-1 receptor domain-containing protein [Chthoniobacterales bacterium]